MKPIEFAGQTVLFGPPKNWDQKRDGECGELPVRVEQAGDITYCFSVWKPSREDLAALLSGAKIQLMVVGQQPPVWVSVADAKELP